MDGNRLKELRKETGMTQPDLATHLSLSVQAVKSYEQGRSDPDDETKLKIAKLFNISLDYLLGATDLPVPLYNPVKLDLPKGLTENDIPKINEYVKLILDAKK